MKSGWTGQGNTGKLLACGSPKKAEKQLQGEERERTLEPRGCFFGTEGEGAKLAVTQKMSKLTATNREGRTRL